MKACFHTAFEHKHVSEKKMSTLALTIFYIYIIYLLNHACILQLAYKQQQIFQNDAFNWSKMTVMPFIMLPNNFDFK